MPLHMYDDLAEYWTLLSPVEDYAEEAEVYRRAIAEHAPTPPRSMLELGSGGGNNAYHLKRHFEPTLVDLSDAMLAQSKKINPELTHVRGDMRDVRLERRFDVVFVHDAISYMATRSDLKRALLTVREHCVLGGIALLCPDETRETFEPQTSHGGHDAEDGRGLRYLEWTWDPDPSDETIVTEYALLARSPRGQVRAVHEQHLHGLFERRVWLETLAEVGFEPHARTYEHSELPNGHELFIGIAR